MGVMAIDHDYEAFRPDWRPARIWDWTRRRYCDVLVSPLRWGMCAPCDPDRYLDEAKPFFRKQNGGGRKGDTARRVIELLRERGPMSPTHIANALGKTQGAVKSALSNNLTTFTRLGRDSRGYVLYGLRGVDDGGSPPAGDGEG